MHQISGLLAVAPTDFTDPAAWFTHLSSTSVTWVVAIVVGTFGLFGIKLAIRALKRGLGGTAK